MTSGKFNILIVLSFIFISVSLFAQEMDAEAAKLFNQGNTQMKQGDYNAAINSYNSAIKIQNDYRIHYQKGIAQKKINKLQESIETFNECIKLKPDFDLAYNARGGSYYSLGNMKEAVDDFQKVVEISKNSSLKAKAKEYISMSYTKLGNNLLNDGKTDEAIAMLKKAIENHGYDAAYLYLAKAYYEIGQYDNAISTADNIVKMKNSSLKGGANFYLGLAYKGKGDLTKAREFFNLAKGDVNYKKSAEYELSLLK